MFPAYAGMIPVVIDDFNIIGSVPRIRGDDPDTGSDAARKVVCSPHTRG